MSEHQADTSIGAPPLVERRMAKLSDITTLDARAKLVVEYMTHGVSHPLLARRTNLPPGTPLTLTQAGELAGFRRRRARQLQDSPAFQTAIAASVAKLRSGEAARSVHTIIATRDAPGDGKAADRKVQLQAAQALLGEGGNRTAVSVTVNNTVQPGYTIIYPSDDAAAATTIDLQANEPPGTEQP